MTAGRQRRWDECSGDPCICPNPAAPLTVNFGAVAEMAIKQERARWLDWLAEVGYGWDFTHDPHPPCTVRELAEVYNDLTPFDDDANADIGETGVDVHVWVIGEQTGWESCDNCNAPDLRKCDCDES